MKRLEDGEKRRMLRRRREVRKERVGERHGVSKKGMKRLKAERMRVW